VHPTGRLTLSRPLEQCVCCFTGNRRRSARIVFRTAAAEEKTMKLSARNQLKGKVMDITKGATTSHVCIEIGQGVTITSSITNEAVADLGCTWGRSGSRHPVTMDSRDRLFRIV
jgi:molybdopterin-binding protein